MLLRGLVFTNSSLRLLRLMVKMSVLYSDGISSILIGASTSRRVFANKSDSPAGINVRNRRCSPAGGHDFNPNT